MQTVDKLAQPVERYHFRTDQPVWGDEAREVLETGTDRFGVWVLSTAERVFKRGRFHHVTINIAIVWGNDSSMDSVFFKQDGSF
jgi:hypothetical protein